MRKDGVLSSWDPDKVQNLDKGIQIRESDTETKVTVISALKKLSVNQRKAILLRYYADFTVSEVAQVMGVSESAVRTHLGRAKKKLRQELADMKPKLWPAFAGPVRNSRRKSR